MRSCTVVVVDVARQNAFQMALTQNDQVKKGNKINLDEYLGGTTDKLTCQYPLRTYNEYVSEVPDKVYA